MMTAPEPDGIVWHTSSYSHGGSACVEVGWRSYSYSCSCSYSYSYNGGTCVEVAPARDAVLVRDSKNRTGLALSVTPTAWQTFLTTLPH